jgi:SPP1 family predicted phage head-tail adaptor
VRAGKLHDRIDIQVATESADGSGQLIRTWANVKATWPAEHIYTSGGEALRGRQLSAQTSDLFRIRTIDEVTTEHRVVWNGTNYGIVQVSEPFTREQWLQCKAAD